MVKVNIVAVGFIKENYLKDAIKEYSKRLGRFCLLNIIEVDEESKEKAVKKKIDLESSKLINAVKGGFILLDRQGKFVSSEELAEMVEECAVRFNGEISFVVGGSNGVNEALKSKAKHIISFGKITYPHQLFRVVLLEQIYRAFSILNNLPYHKWGYDLIAKSN